ncbi:universal stress protein, partial [Amycolatopsis sp. H20-H5]|uniref:universal stress protein n=1 Tax=Amycolatopsis sp. H20-H5 TaxID=3046309 RepID=UPI002DB62A37
MRPTSEQMPVVVGIDGSRSAVEAALWAGDEAVRRQLPVKLIHTYVVPTARVPIKLPTVEMVRDGLESSGLACLREAETAVSQRWPELHVDTVVREAEPVGALIHESAAASLMVLGTRGLGGFTGMLIGSTAVALAHHGHCPVVVARGAGNTAEPVVVGVDGSPASEAALAFAFEEAFLREAPLIAVRTWNAVLGDGSVRPHVLTADPVAIAADERRALEEQLSGWRDKYPDGAAKHIIRRGRPVRTLLELGAHAQLLVVGSRG